MLKMMFFAGLGGFMGTCLRFLTGKMCHALAVTAFPWATFIVNMVGSFLIGLFLALAEKSGFVSPAMNVFLVTGFCGGLTTFSSFADDIYLMLEQRHWLLFVLYAGLTFVFGLIMVCLGRWVVK
ncbi:MAG: fluoride efflux transporter CrcB [Alistipes sp.]|nr:fluoride efflux transporter CrcB [Alistipes sp.]